ncbi:hypothetical protein [Azotosporobacter soli]|uniref:hypothetical protein n=1 Tax=Azotosporobacter soli TaxID=3055040 RepID=UPI0031FF154E
MRIPADAHFTKVYVHSMTGGVARLLDGTGTSNCTGTVFYCGSFDKDERPTVGEICKIEATVNGTMITFRGKCFDVGNTCSFDVME